MQRREFLLASTTAALASTKGQSEPATADSLEASAKSYLRAVMVPRDLVESFIKGRTGEGPAMGWKYDAQLGWVPCQAIRSDGINRSRCFYNYEADGARRVIHFPDKPCRIHTYGNSFTHGSQVSDGETWQEYLAAHFQEPIRNYGVGGYSVYQAYRRMLQVEKQSAAKYIILNIFEHDHFRNLDAWRSISAGMPSDLNDRLFFAGPRFTMPFVRVNVGRDRCESVDNLLQKPDDVLKLCDEKFVWETFKDDPVLKVKLSAAHEKLAPQLVDSVEATFGFSKAQRGDTNAARRIETCYTEAALFASQHIVHGFEQFAAKTGKRLFLVLSFGRITLKDELEGKPRFDRSFLDWLKKKPFPVLDMRDAFRAEYKNYQGDLKKFLDRYFHGHHTPAGNFFTAWTLKDHLLKWLDPLPTPYLRPEKP